MPNTTKPVLIIGGSGVVGSKAARFLRRLHPDLAIAIGGRDRAKAQAVAAEIGHASAEVVDLERPDLGLPRNNRFGAVAVFVKDSTLNTLRYSLEHKLPYVSVSSGTFEIGPEVALFIHKPDRAPVLMASQWLAGAAVLPILHFASAYESIDKIHIGVVLDEQDMGGPAAAADYERLTTVSPAALIIEDGKVSWVAGEEGSGRLRSVDGVDVPAQAYSPFDVISLAAGLNARSIRFDLAYGESASRRRGAPYSTEIIIALTGRKRDGSFGTSHHEIVHPDGQAPLTALSVALGLERLLGLDGAKPAVPGLYLPESLIEPAYYVRRAQEFGARFTMDGGEGVMAPSMAIPA